MSDLCVGVIGGMGPDATVDFMARVLALTPASGDHDHIRMLVDQDPKIPNRQRAILGSGESPGPRLAAIASRLEACNCDFLVMPCNTAHVFLGDILDVTRIPFLSIIDVTMARVHELGVKRAGLLASAACLQAGVYQGVLEAAGVKPVIQESSELADLSLAIGRLFGLRWGILSLASLVLLFPESLAPKWILAVVLGLLVLGFVRVT